MSIIGSIIVGGIAGGLGKLVMPGKDPGGIIVTILLGVAGAVLANYVSPLLGISADGGLIFEIITAAIGAIVLLFLYRMFLKMRGGGAA
ncbi:MAG: GlsB/YeaQ/YmgE family stress response membrane protein [Chakrabartia sp.]